MNYPEGVYLSGFLFRHWTLLPKGSLNNPGFSRISWENNTRIG